MRMIAVGLCMALGTSAMAQCPIGEPEASAIGWSVIEGEDALVAVSSRYPDLAIELWMNSPSTPQILSFRLLPKYQRRVAVMRYFSGEPGTSHLMTLVDQVVIDMTTHQEIGRGSWSEDCEPVKWVWLQDRVEVHGSEDGFAKIMLP